MDVVVHKYGGSSVADLDKIRRVAARVAAARATGVGVVVVVSAMGSSTNQLIGLARQISDAPDRRELDMLLSTGERVSTALVAMALRAIGVPARSLTGSQSGIITDEVHTDARVLAVRVERLRQHLEAGEVVVVSGFQGVSREREITTLGRGGSDTTAVVLAAALGAVHCEICSDVDGVWSADPARVPDAVKLDVMGLDEALALARGGAKVLFEDAVRYARDHGVEIHATATFGPGSGTRLVTSAPGPAGPAVATAVTGDAQLVLVALRTADDAHAVRAAGGRLRRHIGAQVWVDVRNAHAGLPEGLVQRPAAVVTAVGSGLGERAGVGLGFASTLAQAGVAVLAHGGEADSLWWDVAPERLDDAVRLAHAGLVRPT